MFLSPKKLQKLPIGYDFFFLTSRDWERRGRCGTVYTDHFGVLCNLENGTISYLHTRL